MTAPNDDGANARDADPAKTTTTNTEIVPDFDTPRQAVALVDKRTKTLQARLALRGYEMHIVSAAAGAAEFWISRWGMTKVCASLADVESFGEQVGA